MLAARIQRDVKSNFAPCPACKYEALFSYPISLLMAVVLTVTLGKVERNQVIGFHLCKSISLCKSDRLRAKRYCHHTLTISFYRLHGTLRKQGRFCLPGAELHWEMRPVGPRLFPGSAPRLVFLICQVEVPALPLGVQGGLKNV